jgi:hypothetical protein
MFVCDKQKTVTLCFVFLNETWIYLQAAKLEISETTRKFQKEIKLKELYYYVMKAKELGKKKKGLRQFLASLMKIQVFSNTRLC